MWPLPFILLGCCLLLGRYLAHVDPDTDDLAGLNADAARAVAAPAGAVGH